MTKQNQHAKTGAFSKAAQPEALSKVIPTDSITANPVLTFQTLMVGRLAKISSVEDYVPMPQADLDRHLSRQIETRLALIEAALFTITIPGQSLEMVEFWLKWSERSVSQLARLVPLYRKAAPLSEQDSDGLTEIAKALARSAGVFDLKTRERS